MRLAFDCPVCDGERWEAFDAVTYGVDEHTSPHTSLTEYERLRRRVLFEIWSPGRDSLTLRAQLCSNCGFVAYAPRPSIGEVHAKYRFLQKEEKDIGGSGVSRRARRRDEGRAASTYSAVASHLPSRPLRVLDFGGGDGKLLEPFLRRGHDCALVDYNVRPRPGIVKLGDTLDDLPSGACFDVILCSHVLEHLPDPAAVVRELARSLASDGRLFAEVPLEIWKGIPIAREPVTHLNFFTVATLSRLCARNGLEVLEAGRRRGSYAESSKDVVLVVAGPGPDREVADFEGSVEETRRLLDPTVFMELATLWRERRLPSARGVRRRLRSAWPGRTYHSAP